MPKFTLTRSHIQDGLTDQDFSGYAGFPVITFRLSDFPHWDVLQAGRKLSGDQLLARTGAIYAAIKRAIPVWPPGNIFTLANARSLATVSTPANLYLGMTRVNPPYAVFEHFTAMVKKGIDQTFNAASEAALLPGLLDEKIPVTEASRNNSAIVVRYRRDYEARDYWAALMEIGKNKIAHVPADNAHILMCDLHEMRHLRQMDINPDGDTPHFYQELDAELFVRSVLRQADFGLDTATAALHMRYINMIVAPPIYWFAPALEAIEAKNEPPDFPAIQGAVEDIRSCLLTQDGAPQTGDGAYLKWLESFYRHAPEKLFASLRNLADENAFTNPLSAHIAARIIEAADYFNPELTQPRLHLSARKHIGRLLLN